MTFESKFRNFVGRVEKISREEVIIISRELLKEFNQEEKKKVMNQMIINDDLTEDENWTEVNNQIERSNIKRYSWKKILGETLTKRILKLRKEGLIPEETIKEISNCDSVTAFIDYFPKEENNMIKNIKINVHARYGENKTSEKIKLE